MIFGRLGEALVNSAMDRVEDRRIKVDWQLLQLAAFGVAVLSSYMVWRNSKKKEVAEQ